jgi:hypothetical protein
MPDLYDAAKLVGCCPALFDGSIGETLRAQKVAANCRVPVVFVSSAGIGVREAGQERTQRCQEQPQMDADLRRLK